MFKITVGRYNHTTRTLHRLGDESSHLVGTNLDNFVFKPGRRIGGKNSIVLIALMEKSIRWANMREIRFICSLVMHA